MINKYLEKLIEGNKRFVEEKPEHPNRCQETRSSVFDKQNPFAIVISCSDSRVPVEIIFDVGIGDLFIVRSAGHILTQSGIASIEYAVQHLGVELIIVLGHCNCGAVKAAIDNNGQHFSPSIKLMIDRIKPAIEKANKTAKSDEELFDLSVKYNILETIEFIKSSDNIIKNSIKNKKLSIIGANYHIETGIVEII